MRADLVTVAVRTGPAGLGGISLLVVEADISNTLNDDRFVYYRFKWVDAGGMQVGDGESWKQLKVMGQQVQTVKAVAPNSNGADFRLEFNVE